MKSIEQYAIAWKVDKDSKISYTDQLAHNIRWSIFTGEIRWREKLPPIRALAEALSLSVNTVRNAYKQLEMQELVITRPHNGTIVQQESMDKRRFEEENTTTVKNALYYCMSVEEVRAIVERVLTRAQDTHKKQVIFVYESEQVGQRFARQIEEEADVQVQAVDISLLAEYLQDKHVEELDAIITTYFIYSKVRSIARSYQPIIYGMTVEPSGSVIDAVKHLPGGSVVWVICKKEESADGFVNRLKEINPSVQVEVYHEEILNNKNMTAGKAAFLCVSPSLYDKAKQAGGGMVPVCEMWDKINEQSMNMLRDYLH